METLLIHEEIPGTVVLKNSVNPGSVVAQGPRFLGGVEVVFQLPFMGGAWIFTRTALIDFHHDHHANIMVNPKSVLNGLREIRSISPVFKKFYINGIHVEMIKMYVTWRYY